MGVLSCDRNGCDRIMCDRYSSEYGYICWECFDELVASGPTTDIEVFMNSLKRINRDTKEESQARYNVVFKERD